jgi:signal transduction histidine kinase
MGNICKYAMEGTRLYVELYREDRTVYLSLQNTSREHLTADGEELTGRFVRGDKSRNTEGSGLGLSIAQSLVELHGGTFTVSVEGDLFKVTLGFPVVAEGILNKL